MITNALSKSIHLPGLNGLRAIAALSVMWGHTFQSDFGNWGVEGFTLPVVADGVTLFFVIGNAIHKDYKSPDVNLIAGRPK